MQIFPSYDSIIHELFKRMQPHIITTFSQPNRNTNCPSDSTLQIGGPIHGLLLNLLRVFPSDFLQTCRELWFVWNIDLLIQQPLPIKSMVKAMFHHTLMLITHASKPAGRIFRQQGFDQLLNTGAEFGREANMGLQYLFCRTCRIVRLKGSAARV